MNPHDKLLIGFDLKKDPEVVEKAYNDPHGHTRDFNLNLLSRINRELDGEFDVNKFRHVPHYDEQKGVAVSYIQSTEDQRVTIKATGKSYEFKAGEKIHTEISRKYDIETIEKIAKNTGLIVKETFYDSQKYFVDVLFEKQLSIK